MMWYDGKHLGFDALKGLTLTNIDGLKVGSDRVTFTAEDGRTFVMYHSQDCCESVDVNEIVGEPDWLVGTPIVEAYESTNSAEPKPSEYADSFTWTFYHLATQRGFVMIRWLGESNGYYSESVDFVETTPSNINA